MNIKPLHELHQSFSFGSKVPLEHSYFENQSFERRFRLPDNVVEEGIQASYNNGVLKITLQKEKMEKSAKKEIKIS